MIIIIKTIHLTSLIKYSYFFIELDIRIRNNLTVSEVICVIQILESFFIIVVNQIPIILIILILCIQIYFFTIFV